MAQVFPPLAQLQIRPKFLHLAQLQAHPKCLRLAQLRMFLKCRMCRRLAQLRRMFLKCLVCLHLALLQLALNCQTCLHLTQAVRPWLRRKAVWTTSSPIWLFTRVPHSTRALGQPHPQARCTVYPPPQASKRPRFKCLPIQNRLRILRVKAKANM